MVQGDPFFDVEESRELQKQQRKVLKKVVGQHEKNIIAEYFIDIDFANIKQLTYSFSDFDEYRGITLDQNECFIKLIIEMKSPSSCSKKVLLTY